MPHTHTTRRLVAGFAASLLVAAPLALANTAGAAPTVPTGLDACVQQNGVYVVVNAPLDVVVTQQNGSSSQMQVTQTGPGVAACVTNPATGTDALRAAGVTITNDASGMICALNNYPNPCPATFDGQYWQYYQASAADAEAGQWTYATAGSDDTHPQAGWVEGWCYGAQCLPTLPSDDATPPMPEATPVTAAITNGPGAWITVVGVVVVILVLGTITIVRLRRR